jgi:hypothetical protein
MKRFNITILFAALTCMSSCLVCSLHPFFKTEDKRFEPVLLGSWMDGDSCRWDIAPHMVSEHFMGPQHHDSSYTITYYEEDGKPAHLVGTLFRINGVDYVDFTPNPNEDHCLTDFSCFHHVPVHSLARVRYSADSIMIYWYGEEWLSELFEEHRIRIRHEKITLPEYYRHLLTADTEELQKFIRKFANDPAIIKEIEEVFARGYTDDQSDQGLFLKLKPLDPGV